MGERATNGYQKRMGPRKGGEGEYLAIADEGYGGICSRADDDDEEKSGTKVMMKWELGGGLRRDKAGWNC